MTKVVGLPHKKTQLKNFRQERSQEKDEYGTWDALDGQHPWQQAVPNGYIKYPVRKLQSGHVAYLNFQLAKEMGLLPPDHPHRMNKRLERKLLDTFSIRIINEYDQQQRKTFAKKDMKPFPYMATRYLQLQHPGKRGETSGDGRCVWNGVITNNGIQWDVSSRGTGVTALAPGVVEAGRPLPSGSTKFGYGCGMAEIDELYGAAIMAEILHKNGLNTERVLCVIDLGDGNGIGVRAAKNLMRPAHLFLHLKQGNYESLKRAADYLILRQHKNKEWKFGLHNQHKYNFMLEEICESFAQFTAQLDRDYIFAWLDWDGDNVLINAGIIDYGSVRQFGLRHDQYRYDDVQRWSTNLNEQRLKARQTIQVFAQLVDFLNTKKKKPLHHFKNHKILKNFDRHFEYYLLDRFLYQIGFVRKDREYLLKKQWRAIQDLYQTFSLLERAKTSKKPMKVADGINRPAIYNARKLLTLLPDFLISAPSPFKNEVIIPPKEVFKTILAEHAGRKDSKLTASVQEKILKFQQQYKELLRAFTTKARLKPLLQQLAQRSQIINREDRITGNSLLFIVSEILDEKAKGLSDAEIQDLIDTLTEQQCLQPDLYDLEGHPKLHGTRRSKKLMKTVLELVDGYKEDI